MSKKYLIIGAGFSGAVLAERLTQSDKNCEVSIIESKDHIGGNCYSAPDPETKVMVHVYGPHIFHTDNQEVWNYINKFTTIMPYVHRVQAKYNGKIYSLPINLRTINQLFDKSFNPDEAAAFIESIGDKSITTPQNFEEQALKFIGKELYHAFFYGYTKKQWGVEPKILPASILKRLPVRFNYNDNYHPSTNTGIPKDGYTAIFEKMLDHPNIKVHLNTNFDSGFSIEGFDHAFYTGPIDAYFEHKFGRLGYRTIFFESFNRTGDFQGTAQMNYTELDVPQTRITEFKHFTPWLNFEKTTYTKEYSKETSPNDIPYYPKRLSEDMEKFNHYQKEVNNLKNVTFLGRLATYRYMDMHQVIAEALDIAKQFEPK